MLATIHDFVSAQLWNCVCGSNFTLRPAVMHEQVRTRRCCFAYLHRTVCAGRCIETRLSFKYATRVNVSVCEEGMYLQALASLASSVPYLEASIWRFYARAGFS